MAFSSIYVFSLVVNELIKEVSINTHNLNMGVSYSPIFTFERVVYEPSANPGGFMNIGRRSQGKTHLSIFSRGRVLLVDISIKIEIIDFPQAIIKRKMRNNNRLSSTFIAVLESDAWRVFSPRSILPGYGDRDHDQEIIFGG